MAALLLPLAAVPVASAAPPGLRVVLPVIAEFFFPGQVERINGQFVVEFPSDAECAAGLPYAFTAIDVPPGVSVRIETPNGTLPSSEVRPGENVSLPLVVEIEVSTGIEAYERVDVRVRAATQACGTLEAAQTTGQTGARVGFLPKVRLLLLEEASTSWRIRAVNDGNARVRVDWQLVHPTLGRLVSGGSVSAPGPESGENRSAEFLVSRQRVNESARLQINAQIVYEGDYPYRPDERPAIGNATLVLYEPPGPPGGGTRLLQFTLVGAALLLIVGGIAGGWWLRRRKP